MNKQVKVALLFLGSILIFFLAYFFLKGTLLNQNDYTYYAKFQNVEGLKASDKIFVNGVQVGFIKSIGFISKANPHDVLLTCIIDKLIKIPTNSQLQVTSITLMGNKGIDLKLGNQTNFYQNRDTLKGLEEVGMLDKLTASLDPLTQNAQLLLDPNNPKNLQQTIAQLHVLLSSMTQLTQTLNQVAVANQNSINKSMKNIEILTSSLAANTKNLNELLSNTNDITKQLKNGDLEKTLTKLNTNLDDFNKIVKDVNQGKGNMGKLLKDEKLYDNLNGTINSANLLLDDMKANPNRYIHFSVFGGKK
ncbi:MAG: MlaD family protein [Chitinophagales bacterium]|jgi:phospholipid/cholesterol/gamma-HCH transport system substrate-binding protein|nr:MlaD family protein [Chitinophagales bacterium]